MNAFQEWLKFMLAFLMVTSVPVLVMVAILEDYRKHIVACVIAYTWLALMVINVILNFIGVFMALFLFS